MAKAAKVKVRVSTQPVVVMEAEVARKIRQHARTSMKAEVCGVLIGSTEHERMTVEACIQGINAAQGGAHVTFTQDTWEHIYKIKDKEYPDQKIVGWYHSHPGFGVFLSEHDLFIQQNFFSNPQQVAWVFDPHTDEEGCFGWVGDKIEKLSAIRVGYSQDVEITAGSSDHEEDDVAFDPVVNVHGGQSQGSKEPAWMRWATAALGYLAMAVLGFVGGYELMAFKASKWADDLATYQYIQQHPVDACQQILRQVLSLPSGPAVVPGAPGTETAPPGAQAPPTTGAQAPPTTGAQTAPTPGVQAAPAHGVQNPKPASPQQGTAPAQKGNDGKH
jgi:proteasome lid subunit RPN8/RPN11